MLNDNQYNNIVSRTKMICDETGISFIKYMFHDQYQKDSRKRLKTVYIQGTDGLTDSVKVLLVNYNCYNKHVLKLRLSPF